MTGARQIAASVDGRDGGGFLKHFYTIPVVEASLQAASAAPTYFTLQESYSRETPSSADPLKSEGIFYI